jgi:hypothetical protein
MRWARTADAGRQTFGAVHLVIGDSERTACGRLYAWNWYTTKAVAATECRNCLRVANKR